MKKNWSIYWFRIISILLWSTVVAGCSEDASEPPAPTTLAKDEGVIMITTREVSDSPDDAIRTLRLFLFAENGDGTTSLVLNKLFNTADAGSLRPEGYRSFFVKEGEADKKQYIISELLKKGTIKIMMVANELIDMSSVNTVEGVKNDIFNFYNIYANDKGVMDIQIDASGTTSNKGYIPMFAELSFMTEYEWNAANGTIEVPLERLLAKVVLKLDYRNIKDKNVTIQSASMIQVPSQQFISSEVKYGSDLVTIAPQPLKVNNQYTTDQAIFYVPEYLLSDASKQKGLYACIQLNAEVNVGGKIVNSFYNIPIGSGIKDVVDLSDASIQKLTAEQLSVQRNTEYTIEPSVETTGTLQVFKVNINIEEWKTQSINGDVNPPCLVLSTLEWKYDPTPNALNRIYFWTNIEHPELEKNVVMDNGVSLVDKPISEVFSDLLFAEGMMPNNFHLFPTTESIQYPHNGYFDLELLNAELNKGHSFKLTFNAGGLKRTIKVTIP